MNPETSVRIWYILRTAKLSKQIHLFVTAHLAFFQKFDEIVVYYDNGQIELTRVLTSALTVLLSNVAFRLVKPSDYKLFQLVDMFCSLELTAIKFETNTASRSDTDFFHSQHDFHRNYLKTIRRKRLRWLSCAGKMFCKTSCLYIVSIPSLADSEPVRNVRLSLGRRLNWFYFRYKNPP
jgi:hypothetical protein